MHRTGRLLVALATLACSSQAGASPAPLPTRWMAPPGVERLPHDVWRAERPFRVREVAELTTGHRWETGRVAVIVESALYPTIEASLDQYQEDLARKGLGSLVSLVDGGSPANLRTYLVGLYNEAEGLVGTVLVGDIPYVIYELMQDWDGVGGDPAEYEDFPFDLFFMDMDGDWLDNGAGGTVPAGNGKYDVWDDPDHHIEIWCGRMYVSTLPGLGTPGEILTNYFSKDHLYRTGGLDPETPSARGLVYVDDDWGDMVDAYHGDAWCVRQVYGTGNVVKVFDVGSDPGNNATAADYKTNHLPADYQLVLLRSHGYPGGHGFYQDHRAYFRWAMAADYLSIDPPALFYSMFVCSGCDYTAEYGEYGTYVGGAAAFNDEYGLFSWGSAKTGGMWNDEFFYDVLDEPDAFGPAFVEWFNASHDTYPEYAPPWWYGMVMIGDPALIPNGDYYAPQTPEGLTAESGDGRVDLSWSASPAADLHSYGLYRGTDRATPEFLAWVLAPQTTCGDSGVTEGVTYTYWATAVDSSMNESEYSTPAVVTYASTAVASLYGLPGRPVFSASPNPFNPSTEILFSLDREGPATLAIYDVSGRCVRTLVAGSLACGVHAMTWDGRDDLGVPAGSGVYAVRLTGPDGRERRLKLVLLK
jgi:hypothetical protein